MTKEATSGKLYQLKKLLVGQSDSGFVSSLQTTLANILILVVNIMTGIITARLLGPNDKGVQAAVILWPGLLISLSAIGLPAALLYHIKKSNESVSTLLSSALALSMLAGILATGIGVIFVPLWLAKYPPGIIHVTQIYMLFIPIAVLNSIYTSVIQARGDFQTFNGFRLLQPLVTLAILFVLAATNSVTASTAAFAFLCPSIPALFWLWLRTRHLYPVSFKLFPRVYRKLLSYGFRSYSGDILAVAVSQLDKVIIVSLLSPASMGIYAVAFSLARMLVVFRTAVSSVILPKMIGQPISEIRVLLGRASRISTLATSCAAIFLLVLGPFLINLFYGREYQSAITVFWILTLDSVLGGLVVLLAQIFYALGKPELMFFRYAASLAITVPSMLVLGGRFGIVGVASAILLESIIMIILTLSAFPTILKIPIPKLWAPKEDFAYISRLWSEWKR